MDRGEWQGLPRRATAVHHLRWHRWDVHPRARRPPVAVERPAGRVDGPRPHPGGADRPGRYRPRRPQRPRAGGGAVQRSHQRCVVRGSDPDPRHDQPGGRVVKIAAVEMVHRAGPAGPWSVRDRRTVVAWLSIGAALVGLSWFLAAGRSDPADQLGPLSLGVAGGLVWLSGLLTGV